jgi:DNA-binding response OmpR family regulator
MRVLVVEDDARASDFLVRGLRENAFEVESVADGENALIAESAHAFDAVILDLLLPRMSGLEVCRELRQRGSNVPVLMLTALDSVPDTLSGFACGADDYVTKPFAFAELVARLSALIRRSTAGAANIIQVDDLVIDRRARTAARAGLPLELSTTEYELLEYLAQHRDRLVSKRELSREVWGQDFDPTSNVIAVYIARLRKKIDGGRSQPLIRSRRGEGYALSAATAGELDDTPE